MPGSDWRQNGEAGAFARQEPHHGHVVYAGDVKAKRIETLGIVGLQLGAGAEPSICFRVILEEIHV